jgi:hypothetical protein
VEGELLELLADRAQARRGLRVAELLGASGERERLPRHVPDRELDAAEIDALEPIAQGPKRDEGRADPEQRGRTRAVLGHEDRQDAGPEDRHAEDCGQQADGRLAVGQLT